MRDRDPQLERDSFLSVRRKWWAIFSFIFSIEMIAASVFVIRYEVTRGSHSDIEETIMAVFKGLAPVPMLALVSCIMLFQGVEVIMFIRDFLANAFIEPMKERQRQQGRAMGLAEGLAEGRAEGHAEGHGKGRVEGEVEMHREWDSWLKRFMEASEKGEPFDEPPPKPTRESCLES